MDELSDSVADKFWRLAKLAYDCYNEKSFVFSDVPEDLIELGFFQSFPRMYSHKDASSCHSFLHLTVQEYLTALHASKSNSTQNQITTIQNINYMHDSNTYLFFAGLTQSLSHVIIPLNILFHPFLKYNLRTRSTLSCLHQIVHYMVVLMIHFPVIQLVMC